MASAAAKMMTPISACKHAQSRAAARRSAGFTLLEILLVLTLLGLASVLVLPNLGSLDNRTFSVQVRQAVSLLNYARRIAVVQGQPSTASFYSELALREDVPASLTSVGFWQADDATVLHFRDSAEQEEEVEELIEISFYPEGGSTGGSLLLEQDAQRVTITIDPFTGRVTTTTDDD